MNQNQTPEITPGQTFRLYHEGAACAQAYTVTRVTPKRVFSKLSVGGKDQPGERSNSRAEVQHYIASGAWVLEPAAPEAAPVTLLNEAEYQAPGNQNRDRPVLGYYTPAPVEPLKGQEATRHHRPGPPPAYIDIARPGVTPTDQAQAYAQQIPRLERKGQSPAAVTMHTGAGLLPVITISGLGWAEDPAGANYLPVWRGSEAEGWLFGKMPTPVSRLTVTAAADLINEQRQQDERIKVSLQYALAFITE